MHSTCILVPASNPNHVSTRAVDGKNSLGRGDEDAKHYHTKINCNNINPRNGTSHGNLRIRDGGSEFRKGNLQLCIWPPSKFLKEIIIRDTSTLPSGKDK